jgi:hypothetical protein
VINIAALQMVLGVLTGSLERREREATCDLLVRSVTRVQVLVGSSLV